MFMTIGFILSIFAMDVMGEELIKFTDDHNGTVTYYDKNSINRESEIVRVWIKINFNKKNKEWSKGVEICKNNSEQESINDCNELSYMKDYYKINCKEDTINLILGVMFDVDGHFIFSTSSLKESSYHIPHRSMFEKLKKQVCN